MTRRAARTIVTRAIVAAGLLLTGAAAFAGQSADGAVKVTADRGVDFSRFRSYIWSPSQPAPSKAADDRIVAAVDRQLQALGMTKASTGTADVIVTYSALRAGPTDEVDTLVVGMLEPGTRRRLLQLRSNGLVEGDAAARDRAIDGVVARLFEHYPTKTGL